MKKIGQLVDNGFDYDDLYKAKIMFDQMNIATEFYHLIQPYTSNDLFNEQTTLSWDTKAKMYGRVVNKKSKIQFMLC